MDQLTEEQKERLQQLRANRDTAKAEKARFRYYDPPTWNDFDFVLSLLDSDSQAVEPHLTERDKTRFLERGFTVVENAGQNLRLIKRDDARQAISIKWEDLSALRELITLALDDGPMVIGPDVSGQSAKNAATLMRDKCVEKVKARLYDPSLKFFDDGARAVVIDWTNYLIRELQSLTLDQVKPGEM